MPVAPKRSSDTKKLSRKEFFEQRKKKEDLRKSLVDSENVKRESAVDAQKHLSSHNAQRPQPEDKNDPLQQLKMKEERFISKLSENEAEEFGRQRKLLVDEFKQLPMEKFDKHNLVKKMNKELALDAIDKHLLSEKIPANLFAEAARITTPEPRLSILGGFDMESYLSEQRMTSNAGHNAMKKFQFNQIASDATPPDRYLRDYRNNL